MEDNMLVGWCFYGVSTLFVSFNAEWNFQQYQFSKRIVFASKQSNVKTVLLQTIQLGIGTQFSSI